MAVTKQVRSLRSHALEPRGIPPPPTAVSGKLAHRGWGGGGGGDQGYMGRKVTHQPLRKETGKSEKEKGPILF